jgi:hypothetical protein
MNRTYSFQKAPRCSRHQRCFAGAERTGDQFTLLEKSPAPALRMVPTSLEYG